MSSNAAEKVTGLAQQVQTQAPLQISKCIVVHECTCMWYCAYVVLYTYAHVHAQVQVHAQVICGMHMWYAYVVCTCVCMHMHMHTHMCMCMCRSLWCVVKCCTADQIVKTQISNIVDMCVNKAVRGCPQVV